MSPDEVLALAQAGARLGCKEALFTLGDRPEARHEAYRRSLRRFGHASTHSYLVAMCRAVLEETGLLPHPNAGVLGRRELAELREVSASQGMMLESVSERLCAPGGPHAGAPDKRPRARLAMLERAGELSIPFTSGILIGIGETPRERVEALLALRDLHERHGHIQEVIVQNFRAKPDTPMADAGEPGLLELMSACAIARLVLGPAMSVQAPPNLSADYGPLLLAGINDWGGISPLTPDFVNPEAPWPEIDRLGELCADAGYALARAAHDLPRVPGRRPLPRSRPARPRPRHGRRRGPGPDRRPGARRAPAGRGGAGMSVTFCRVARGAGPAGAASTREGAGFGEAGVAAALAEGLLPVETAAGAAGEPLAWLADPAAALALAGRGVPGWRIAVRHRGTREDVLDALSRTGAAFLRTDPAGLPEALALAGLPTIATTVSVPVDSLDAAVAAVRGGAGDLLLGAGTTTRWARCARRWPRPSLVERVALPPGVPYAEAYEVLARPLLKAWLDLVDGSGAARPRTGWAPGRDMPAPVPAARLSAAWTDAAWTDAASEELDALPPDLAGILERALSGSAPRRDEVERLFRARGVEVEGIARVADLMRERSCGEMVTYVINRNINYTNQCYFRCGFCGFSRGPKSLNLRGDPYILNVHEVVHRSVEAAERGATEVCLQGGIHPDFTGDFYVEVLEAIKDACRTCTCTGSPRSRSGRAPRRSGSACAAS